MSFWDKIQNDLKKNFEDGLSIVKEGGTAVSKKLEYFTEEGKKKYKVFNLNMKVQEEFAKFGGQVYDAINKKSKNPLGNRKVASTLKKINKLEAQITKLEAKPAKKGAKKSVRKTRAGSTAKTRKKTVTRKKGTVKKQ
jgi:hypothetical protein